MKYQETPQRTNLENYLTEGLCDLLNRMGGERQRELLCGILPECRSLADSPKLSWETQVSISTGSGVQYPDLVGFHKGKPLIVVEAKVGAGFTESVREDDEGHTTILSQLEAYDGWLYEKNPENGILVLLSAFTEPPEEFLDMSSTRYHLPHRHATRWQAVFEQLGKNASSELEHDFKYFLEEVEVAQDAPSRKDFSLLELYMDGACERITHSMGVLRDSLAKEYPDQFNWAQEKTYQRGGFSYEPTKSAAWSWGILQRKTYCYFHWGVKFPVDGRTQSLWDIGFPKLADKTGVFFSIAIHHRAKREQLFPQFKEPWLVSRITSKDAEWPAVCFAPLDKMLEGGTFVEKFHEWLKLRFEDGLEIIDKVEGL